MCPHAHALKVRVSRFQTLEIPEGHVLVVGPTGSGKTNTCKVLLEALLEKGFSFLVLDWHGEYKGVKRYVPGVNLSMNILANVGDPEFVVDILNQVFQLSEPQWYLLQRAVREAGAPLRLSTLIESVEQQPVRDWRDYDIKAALLRRLYLLSDGIMGKVLDGEKPPYFLFREPAIVDLSTLPLKYRSLLALVLLKHLYDFATSSRTTREHVTLVEEAWNVIPYRARWEPPSIGERLFLEVRKFGERVIAVTQRLDDVSERALRNAHLILLHSAQPGDLEKLGVPRELLEGAKPPRRGTVWAIYPGYMRVRTITVRRAQLL